MSTSIDLGCLVCEDTGYQCTSYETRLKLLQHVRDHVLTAPESSRWEILLEESTPDYSGCVGGLDVASRQACSDVLFKLEEPTAHDLIASYNELLRKELAHAFSLGWRSTAGPKIMSVYTPRGVFLSFERGRDPYTYELKTAYSPLAWTVRTSPHNTPSLERERAKATPMRRRELAPTIPTVDHDHRVYKVVFRAGLVNLLRRIIREQVSDEARAKALAEVVWNIRDRQGRRPSTYRRWRAMLELDHDNEVPT